MGVIRTLLALGVLVGHAKSNFLLPMTGGMMAVQAFYIISGFYMGLVLTEKYTKKSNSYTLFITNRFLRIYPIYWLVLLVTFFVSALSWFVWSEPLCLKGFFVYPLNSFALFYTLLVNITVLGQDVLMFVGLNQFDNSFFFTSDFHNTIPRMHEYLLIQPSWTIALEFTFYLFAPALNRIKTKWLVLLVTLSFLSRFAMYLNGFYNDPWYYRFFPFELGFFVLGILAYRWYKEGRILNTGHLYKVLIFILFVFCICFVGSFPGPYMLKSYLVYGFLFLVIPWLFAFTKNSSLDRKIGELSYPLYICHYPILEVLNIFKDGFINENNKAYLLLVLSFISAYFINYLVGEHIEKIRRKRVRSALII